MKKNIKYLKHLGLMQAEIFVRSILGERNLFRYAPMTGVVPALDDKGEKMSKSGDPKSVLYLNDNKEEIKKKIAKIPTDPAHLHILFFFIFRFLLTQKEKEKVNQVACDLISKLSDTWKSFEARKVIPEGWSVLDVMNEKTQ